MGKVINNYLLGDIRAIYVLNEDTHTAELVLLPDGTEYADNERAKKCPDSLAQIKLVGDSYAAGYSNGRTLRDGESVFAFKYNRQEVRELSSARRSRPDACAKDVSSDLSRNDSQKEILTYLTDEERSYELIHHLIYHEGDRALWSYTEFVNSGSEVAGIEMISSFSLGKISPLMEEDGADSLILHRIRSVWSMEGRISSRRFEDLQLEPSWTGHAVRCERFGHVGSLPVNSFFPCMAVEDEKNGLFWGAQLAHNASWQMEVYRRGDDVQISGGIADREFGHFVKNVAPGERFETPRAIISVCKSKDFEEIFGRLTHALNRIVDLGPLSEQHLPVMFNEYCTTWGVPSHENIVRTVDAIKDKGLEYFVIDAGWYKPVDASWDQAMGDYDVSPELFPKGMEATVDYIRKNGLKPGIWFEIDNVACKAKAYQMEDMLLHRDGRVLTTLSRRFWDLKQDAVTDYLSEKVIGTLKRYGFEYMKIDCNDEIGIGCDGAESLGEGLRLNAEASVKFIRKVKEEVPGIILENCASGGHKLEPLMMSECSMASFSDAHECLEIPVIAANLHRVILPRQSQIWAAIRKTDSVRRIRYSLCATLLGRMCFSGDVWDLSDEQWAAIDEGISFYKEVSPVIKHGFTRIYGDSQTAYRHLKGYQAVVRCGEEDAFGKCLVVLHGFEGAAGTKALAYIPEGSKISRVYGAGEFDLELNNDKLAFTFTEDYMAIGVLLETNH